MENEVKNQTADPLPFDLMKTIVEKLITKGKFRDALMFAIPCYMMIRFSDFSKLKWIDFDNERISMYEQKTFNTRKKKKARVIKISSELRAIIERCKPIENYNPDAYIFAGKNGKPITIQYANQRLLVLKKQFSIPVVHFSTHSLIKSGSVKLWENSGKSEAGLILLSRIRGHANLTVTMNYLGIGQSQLDAAYDSI